MERKFEIGDYVFAQDWCYGKIVYLTKDYAEVDFVTANGYSCLTFDLKDLKLAQEFRLGDLVQESKSKCTCLVSFVGRDFSMIKVLEGKNEGKSYKVSSPRGFLRVGNILKGENKNENQ